MPGGTPTSEQLHIVVGLSAGMGDNPGAPGSPSPTDKLKEALCSQEVFSKTYLVNIHMIVLSVSNLYDYRNLLNWQWVHINTSEGYDVLALLELKWLPSTCC